MKEGVMGRAFCPRCGVTRNMEVTVSRRRVEEPDGTVRQVVTRTYHCETCGCFVRSEREPVPPAAECD